MSAVVDGSWSVRGLMHAGWTSHDLEDPLHDFLSIIIYCLQSGALNCGSCNLIFTKGTHPQDRHAAP